MRSEGEGPSVTQVISQVQDFSSVPPGLLKRAAERGSMVHTACELFDRDQFDADLYSAEIIDYVDGWLAFRHMHEPTINRIEETIQINGEMPYHGRYDRLVTMDGQPWLLDIKTSSTINKKTCAMQLAAYATGLDEIVMNLGVVHLQKNGVYRLIDLSPLGSAALEHFTRLLICWYARHKFDSWDIKGKA